MTLKVLFPAQMLCVCECSLQANSIISSAFKIMLLPLRQTEGRTFKPSIDTEIAPNALNFIICAAAYKLLSHGMWFELQKQSIPSPLVASPGPQNTSF